MAAVLQVQLLWAELFVYA